MTNATTLRERAINAYQRELRFRLMVERIAHETMAEKWPPDHDYLQLRRRDLADIATAVAAQAFQMFYEEDAELMRLKQERDAYKKLAEEPISIRPPPFFVARGTAGTGEG